MTLESLAPGATERGVTERRFEAAARNLSCPILFIFQADEELMTLPSGIDLFQAIGSTEKTMHLNPGGHVETPPFERAAAEEFFRRHLQP